MSVLITLKFKGDTAKFRQALHERGDEFAKLGEGSKAAGAMHHRFGIGEGYVLVVDEWESLEQFQQFFSDPELQALIATVGATSEPPEMTVAEAVTSPDQF